MALLEVARAREGQRALTSYASRMLLLIRGALNKNMSTYLVHRIEQMPNIELLCETVIRQMVGNGHLKSIKTVNAKTGKQRTVKTPAIFSFIGATPQRIG